jgi:hypothetical protein
VEPRRAAWPGLAAGKGRVPEQFERSLDGVYDAGRGHRALGDTQRLQALQVLHRLEREANPVLGHDFWLVNRPGAS